jgi:hypothetical protein
MQFNSANLHRKKLMKLLMTLAFLEGYSRKFLFEVKIQATRKDPSDRIPMIGATMVVPQMNRMTTLLMKLFIWQCIHGKERN